MDLREARLERLPERERMIEEQLVARGIQSAPVLNAIRDVPREFFLPPSLQASAYADGALQIDCGQTISQPYIVARMTEMLDPRPRDRVLEIGTGSGYQTAVLAKLAAHVWSVEWHLKLMTEAAERLEWLRVTNVTLVCGDGSIGLPAYAPYDAILVTAGAPDVPPALLEQLAVGGRLVAPVGPMQEQHIVRVVRESNGLRRDESLPVRFVKLLGAAGWSE